MTEQRYHKALAGLTFEPAPTTGYYRATRGGKVIEYPASGRVDGGTAFVNLTVLAADKREVLDISEITLVDPDGVFMFRMALPYSETRSFVLINPVKGTYILHVTGKGLQEKYVTFGGVEKGAELNLGNIVLKREAEQ